MNAKLFEMAAKSDAALSKRAGYEKNDTSGALHSLLTHGRVEVGYRQACGKTDQTQHAYREWVKLLKAAEKSGMRIAVEPVKHGNAYATSKGGFWTSAIYTTNLPPNAPVQRRRVATSAGTGCYAQLYYCAVYPPSMEWTLPVIKAARSLSRYATKSATSSRVAKRFMGCTLAIQSVTSLPESIIRGVAT